MAHPQRRGGESDAPVLFLDVDGVLNVARRGAFSRLHGSLLERLARVVRRSRARVVLASSWRHDRQRLALLERAWRAVQLPPLDAATPTLATATALATGGLGPSGGDTYSRQRVLEIQQWLRDEEAQRGRRVRWAAVDDLDLAAAADASDRAQFVRTDPTRGLSVADVETLVHRLTDGDEAGEEEVDGHLSLEAQMVRLSVDLIVIAAEDAAHPTTCVVVDCADFSVVATFDPERQPLRAWLRAQEEKEFSIDRIATVHLLHPRSSTVEWPPHGPLDVRFTTELMPEAFALALARSARTDAHGDSLDASSTAIKLLLEAIEKRDLAECADSDKTAQQLRAIGFSDNAVTGLATGDAELVTRLLEVASTLTPLSRQHVALAIEICRLFPHREDRVARHVLAEYVARSELTSRAALEAVRLIWPAKRHEVHVPFEELDELIIML